MPIIKCGPSNALTTRYCYKYLLKKSVLVFEREREREEDILYAIKIHLENVILQIKNYTNICAHIFSSRISQQFTVRKMKIERCMKEQKFCLLHIFFISFFFIYLAYFLFFFSSTCLPIWRRNKKQEFLTMEGCGITKSS